MRLVLLKSQEIPDFGGCPGFDGVLEVKEAIRGWDHVKTYV